MASAGTPLASVCYGCRFMGLDIDAATCPDCGGPLIRVLDPTRIEVQLLFRTPRCTPRLPGVRVIHAAHGANDNEPPTTAWSVVEFRDVRRR